MCVSTSLGVSSFSIERSPSVCAAWVSGRADGSAVEIDELLERDPLIPAGGGRHDDQGVDAGLVPLLDSVPDAGGSAVERDLRQPAVGHELRYLAFLARGNRAADRLHLVLEPRLDPVVLIV